MIQVDLSTLLASLAILLVSYIVSRWWQSTTYQVFGTFDSYLRHIPTIGSDGVIFSYLDALKFYRHGHEMIHQGYTKYYGRAFKVSMISRWVVIVTGPDMVNDIRQATDDQLSFRDAVAETAQSDYMIGPQIRLDPYHVAIVRTPLTRNLGSRFADIKDEISAGFADLIHAKANEWISINVYRSIMQIVCRTSNRLYVGLPLCRDPDYMELNQQFTIDVIEGGRIINMFPLFLKPIVGRILTKVPKRIEKAVSHVGSLFAEQLEQERLHGKNRPNKPNNLISWLVDEAEGSQREIRDLSLRLLSINFSSIHTTTMAFVHILYDLCAHPEYIAPMREEVEAVIGAEGWTKVSTVNMHKVDSFVKESQRIAIGGLMMRRKVIKDFTFSNGITIPAGTHIAVATNSTHMDGRKYRNPEEFKGFRFAEMREQEGESKKHQMVSLSLDFGTFGTGRHACPGRFFAVNELKTMLAYVLLNYDVKLRNDGPRPENFGSQQTVFPTELQR
ncbi:cytochrome P450 [Gymnopilus junonius]|uniref:Cytochrome P450 n=1 Tax=Gymnopilus junonius TaxID=109634 RepID=A0A9P5TU10_GYMJU|nr:cytochrome P450 [Gymnopilus junonius]